MQRRVFLKSGALALVTMGLSPSFLRRTVMGMSLPRAARGKTLICLFQRGAADALNVVVPFGEKAYYGARPQLAVAAPTRAAGASGAIDLDGFFGLHPSLAPFKPLYDRGVLVPVHAVGSPSATRSHFDAQDYMESATPDLKGTRDGWLNRYLATKGTCEAGCDTHASPFRAVSMTQQTPRILDGGAPVVAMNSLEEFSIRSAGGDAEARLEALYRTGKADLVHGSGTDMFEAMKMLRSANPLQYRPSAGANYPRSPFGQRLQQIAQLIKSDVGLEVAFADVGGWDTHVNQGARAGAARQPARRLRAVGGGARDRPRRPHGRRRDPHHVGVRPHGAAERHRRHRPRARGRDVRDRRQPVGHGGACSAGGPGSSASSCYEGRDLALTTDFRAVFSEVTARHLGGQCPRHGLPRIRRPRRRLARPAAARLNARGRRCARRSRVR